jgi:hypothetical protein
MNLILSDSNAVANAAGNIRRAKQAFAALQTT